MPRLLRFPNGAEANIDDDTGEWVSADKVVEERLRAETEFWFRVACPPGYDSAPSESLVEYLAKTLLTEIGEARAQRPGVRAASMIGAGRPARPLRFG